MVNCLTHFILYAIGLCISSFLWVFPKIFFKLHLILPNMQQFYPKTYILFLEQRRLCIFIYWYTCNLSHVVYLKSDLLSFVGNELRYLTLVMFLLGIMLIWIIIEYLLDLIKTKSYIISFLIYIILFKESMSLSFYIYIYIYIYIKLAS